MSKTHATPWLTLEPPMWEGMRRDWGRKSEEWERAWLCDDVLWDVTNIRRPEGASRLRLHARGARSGLYALGSPFNFTLLDADGFVVAVYDTFYEFLQAIGLEEGDRFDVWLEWK